MRKADLILKSDAVFTGCGNTFPGIVAIKDNRIQYVGDACNLEIYSGKKTIYIDCKRKLIMPGLQDAHVHFYMASFYNSPYICVRNNQTSEEQCVAELAEQAARIPKNRWLIGAGWYHNLWDDPVLPTKASLDRAYPDRPVCMISADCHTMWFNSRGLKKAGLTKDSIPPEGGIYDLDEYGELTGTVHDAAAGALTHKVYEFAPEEENKAYKAFMETVNAYGITSVCDVSMMSVPGGDFIRDDIYSRLLKKDKLTLRITMFPTLMEDLTRPIKLRDKFRDSMLKCNGVKQFFDGVSCCHTAFLTEPYTNAYFEGDCGMPVIPPEKMRAMVLNAHKNDFGIRIHTIGDKAIHLMLDYLEEAGKLYGEKPYLQHTLEHLENILKEDLPRFKELSVMPSVQPPHLLIDPKGVYRDLGTERVQLMWAFRTMLDHGAKLAFGTDCPVSDINPFVSLYNAVTRKDAGTGLSKEGWLPKECITIKEAVRAYTYGSACAAGRGHELGILAPGMLADLIVLDHNILEEAPKVLLETKVEYTIVNGRVVYQAD